MSFEDVRDEEVLHILEYIPIQVSRYEFSLDLFRFSGISRRFYKLVWKRLKGLHIKSRLCVRYIFRKNVPESIFQRMLKLQTISDATETQRNEIFIASVCKGFCNVIDSYLRDRNYEIDPSEMDNEAIREAAKEGQLKMVQLLMKDPRVDPSDSGNEALCSASRGNFVELAKFLMSDERVMNGEGGIDAADYATTSEMEQMIRTKFKNHEVSKSFDDTMNNLNQLLDNFQEELRSRIDGYVQVRTLSSLQNWVKRFHQDMNRMIKEFKTKNYYLKSVASSPILTSTFTFSSSTQVPCPHLTSSQRDEYDQKLSSLVHQFGVIPVPGPKKSDGGLEEGSIVGRLEEVNDSSIGETPTNPDADGMISSYYVGYLDPLHSRPHGIGMIYDVRAYHSLRIRVTGNFTDGILGPGMGREYHASNGALKFVGVFVNGFRGGRGAEFELDGRTVRRRGVWKDTKLIKEDNRVDVRDTEAWLELPDDDEEEDEDSEEIFDDDDDDGDVEFPSPPPSPTPKSGDEEEENIGDSTTYKKDIIIEEEEEEEDGEFITTTTKEKERVSEAAEEKAVMKLRFGGTGSGSGSGTDDLLGLGSRMMKSIEIDQSLEESELFQNLGKRVVNHDKKLQLMFGLVKQNRKEKNQLQASHNLLGEDLDEVREGMDSRLEDLGNRLREEQIHVKREFTRLRRCFESNRLPFWEGWRSMCLAFILGIIFCYSYILFFVL